MMYSLNFLFVGRVILFLQWREKNTQVLYLPVDEPIPADNQSTHEPISWKLQISTTKDSSLQ